MNEFTVEQIEREALYIKQFNFELAVHSSRMLRAYAARLREDDENAKDAARYRWLRDNLEHPSYPYFENGRWHIPYQASTALGFGAGVGVETFDTLEAAIDAAMREQGEG